MSDTDAAWAALHAAAERAKVRRIAGLFEAEPDRLQRLTVDAAGLELDLSKQPWSLADLGEALDLARAAGVEAAVRSSTLASAGRTSARGWSGRR